MGSAGATAPPPGPAGDVGADLDRLWSLQQVDGALRAAREALEGHPERAAAEAARREVERLEQAEREQQDRLRQLRLAVRRSEQELADAEREAEQIQSRLFGGAVTHPKELSSLQARLEALRQRAARLQDEALEQMLALEQTEQALSQTREALGRARSEREQAERRWEATRQALEQEVARLERERAELAAAVADSTHLARYERLAAAKSGRALAVVQDERCSACGMPLSAYVMTEARRRRRMVFCEVCGRILYWPPAPRLTGQPG